MCFFERQNFTILNYFVRDLKFYLIHKYLKYIQNIYNKQIMINITI